jgi:hypothetical protein
MDIAVHLQSTTLDTFYLSARAFYTWAHSLVDMALDLCASLFIFVDCRLEAIGFVESVNDMVQPWFTFHLTSLLVNVLTSRLTGRGTDGH